MDDTWIDQLSRRYLAAPFLTPTQQIGVDAQDLIALINAAHALAYQERAAAEMRDQASYQQIAHLTKALVHAGVDRVEFWAGWGGSVLNAKKARTVSVVRAPGPQSAGMFGAAIRRALMELRSTEPVPLSQTITLSKPKGGPP